MSYKHSVVFISQPLLNLFNFEWLLITEYDQAKSTQSTETEETVSLLDYRYCHCTSGKAGNKDHSKILNYEPFSKRVSYIQE